MNDISKCSGTNCPISFRCWRYLVPQGDPFQCYVEPAFKRNGRVTTCENYLHKPTVIKGGTKDLDRSFRKIK